MLPDTATDSSSTAMTLADVISPSLIIPHLRGRQVVSIIQELSQVLQGAKRIPDLLSFYQAALSREFMASTDMEAGMAFPHARMMGVPALACALGRSDEPLTWGASAARPVRLVFLMAIPANDSTQYLRLIAGLARLAKDRQLVEQLHSAQDAQQIAAVLRQVQLRNQTAPA